MIPEITDTERMAPRNQLNAAARSGDRIVGGSTGFFGKVLRLIAVEMDWSGYERVGVRQCARIGSFIGCYTKWMSLEAASLRSVSDTLLSVIVSVGSSVITTLLPDCTTVTSPPAALWAVPLASELAVVPAANMDDENSRTSLLPPNGRKIGDHVPAETSIVDAAGRGRVDRCEHEGIGVAPARERVVSCLAGQRVAA